jgi:hypothetical protein
MVAMTDETAHPVYFQTTQFTCGPSALMKAMHALDPGYRPSRLEELSIWRAANLVFMGEGQAGCGVFGLGHAALSRHFNAEVYGHKIDALFSGWTRHPDEADVQTMMDDHDRAAFLARGGRLFDRKLDIDLLTQLKNEGKQAIVLVTNGAYGHWVLADKVTAGTVEILDPYKAEAHELNMPHHSATGEQSLPHAAFLKWAHFGPQASTVVLALSKRAP